MPARTFSSARTSNVSKSAPMALRIWTAMFENPHCGKILVPFMNNLRKGGAESRAPRAKPPRRAGDDVEPPPDATTKRIQSMVDDNTVMLFMKGTKIFPQCGFSNMAVQILNAIGQDFETYDCLSDENVRSTIKEFSDWPTIPQLYVDGEFVGGSDIMLEMYEAGELQEMIEVAAAS